MLKDQKILARYHGCWLLLTDFKKSVVRVKNYAHGMAFIQCFVLCLRAHYLPLIYARFRITV